MNFSNKILIGIIIAAGVAVYAFNLTNELFWDDTDWIVNNPYVHEMTFENAKRWFSENILAGMGLNSNYYRPVLMATFAINYAIHQTNPVGWHLVSNLIHLANGVLLFALLMRWTKKRFVAFWTALVFVIHPLQTEAVSYISGRGDPLAALFMFLALWWFTRAEASGFPWNTWRRLASLGALVLALLSRETAIMFPFAAMVVYIAFLSSGRFWASVGSAFKKTIPYFLVVFAYGILRLTVLNFDNTLNFYSSGAAGPYTESVLVRVYTFISILPTYARLLLAPLGQHMDRTATVYGSFGFWQVYVPLTALAALLYGTYRSYRTNRTYRGFLFFGAGWFFATISPMSGITPVNGLLYEHWLYLPLIGPFAALAYALYWTYRSHRTYRLAAVAALVILVSWFSYLSVQRNIMWGNPLAFFEDILRYEPSSARALVNAGNIYYYDRNDAARAEAYYDKAVQTKTSFPQAYYNLGRIRRERGDYAGALALQEQAAAVDPSFPFAYQEIAIITAYEGDFARARGALIKAIELIPEDPRGYLNLAKVEQALGNSAAAKANLELGLTRASRDAEAKAEIEKLLAELTK